MHTLRLSVGAALIVAALSSGAVAGRANPPVRHRPGTLHGFLALRSMDGAVIGDGDLAQTIAGDRVTARTTFRFHDGSLNDETAVFSVRGAYRLISYRLVQRGAMFEHPLTLDVDMATGKVAVHSQDEGKDKVDEKTMKLPPDLGNGLLIPLLQDLDAKQLPAHRAAARRDAWPACRETGRHERRVGAIPDGQASSARRRTIS